MIALPLLASQHPAAAQEKKATNPRSLADDTAHLVEKGKYGWESELVEITTVDGTKAKMKLFLIFSEEKGKSTGKMNVVDGNLTSLEMNFELLEKVGKRYIKTVASSALFKDLAFTLEYKIGPDGLTLTGGKTPWATCYVDLSKGVLFKTAK